MPLDRRRLPLCDPGAKVSQGRPVDRTVVNEIKPIRASLTGIILIREFWFAWPVLAPLMAWGPGSRGRRKGRKCCHEGCTAAAAVRSWALSTLGALVALALAIVLCTTHWSMDLFKIYGSFYNRAYVELQPMSATTDAQ